MLRTITPILSIILSILLVMFFVQPEYDEILKLKKDIKDYQSATENYNKFNSELQKLVEAKESLNMADKERLAIFVPNELDTSKLLVALEKIVKQHNMLFGNVSAQESSKDELASKKDSKSTRGGDPTLVSSDLTFSVIGTYPQFKSLIKDLESSLTLFEVINITLENTGETQFQQYSITVRAYAMTE